MHQITQLLNNFSNFQELLKQKNIFIFYAKDYPALFFSYFFKQLKDNHKISIININLQVQEFNEIKHQLEMSFLGRTSFYWLGNIQFLSEKKIKEILDYLNLYKGPNQISLFVETEISNKNFNIINCNNITTQEQFESILSLFSIKKEIASYYFSKIFKLTSVLTLDQVLVLANYIKLVGIKTDEFLENWLDKVLITDQSLFTLSKYFFSLDSKLFFSYWNTLSLNYQPIFWTSYWSEQLFRAYWYVHFMNTGQIAQAKQVAYKLPFSFIQYDWKKHNENKLMWAHQFIYDIDYALKNGGSEFSIELFYAKFFEK